MSSQARVSRRVSAIAPSATLAVTNKAKALRVLKARLKEVEEAEEGEESEETEAAEKEETIEEE